MSERALVERADFQGRRRSAFQVIIVRFQAVPHRLAGVFGEGHDGSHIIGVGETDVDSEDDVAHRGRNLSLRRRRFLRLSTALPPVVHHAKQPASGCYLQQSEPGRRKSEQQQRHAVALVLVGPTWTWMQAWMQMLMWV